MTLRTRLGLYGGPAAPYPSELGEGPDPFAFTAQYGVALSAANVTSNVVIMSGIADSVNVSLSGDASAEYSKNGGAWVTGDTTAVNGDEFQLRVDASASYKTGVTAVLTAGDEVGIFLVETLRDPNATADVVPFINRLRTGRR